MRLFIPIIPSPHSSNFLLKSLRSSTRSIPRNRLFLAHQKHYPTATMVKLVEVTEFGQPPHLVDLPSAPVAAQAPESDLVTLKLLATGIHRLVQSRAAGKHYSAQGLPHIPGVDGVFKGQDGKLYYGSAISPKGGTMAEEIKLPKRNLTPIPDGSDPVQVAGLMNPIMSSWMALATRVTNLPKNFTCVIVGATSLSGTCAITIAREFGAGKVIGIARNVSKMEGLGLDAMIKMEDDVSKTDFSKLGNVDVILDYLYGPIVPHLFASFPRFTPTVQYVQIGSVAGLTTDLPADFLRSRNIVMSGSGPGSWSMQQFGKEISGMVGVVEKIKKMPFQEVPLAEVESSWSKGGERIIVVP